MYGWLGIATIRFDVLVPLVGLPDVISGLQV